MNELIARFFIYEYQHMSPKINLLPFLLLLLISNKAILAKQGHILNLAEGFFLSKLSFHGYLHIDGNLSKSQELDALNLQLKSIIGSLKDKQIALVDTKLDPQKYLKKDLDYQLGSQQKKRVIHYFFEEFVIIPKKYREHDTILVELIDGQNLREHRDTLMECLPELSVSLDYYWYYFEPSRVGCQKIIQQENDFLVYDSSYIDSSNPVFYSFYATLDHVSVPINDLIPLKKILLYEKNKKTLRIFLISESEPIEFLDSQSAGLSFAGFLRTMFKQYPDMNQRFVDHGEDILSVDAFGMEIPAANYPMLLSWILDNSNYPEYLDHEQKSRLRRHALLGISNKLIEWEFDLNLAGREISVELLTYHGDLHPYSSNRQMIERLFKHAYKEADIILHTGHSYYGSGLFELSNFPESPVNNKFQILFWNACYSLGFYFHRFTALKRNSETHLVANALPSCIEGSGISLALGLSSLLSGKKYPNMLSRMNVEKSHLCFWNPARVVLTQKY